VARPNWEVTGLGVQPLASGKMTGPAVKGRRPVFDMGRRAIQLVGGCDAVPCDPKDQVRQNDNGHRYCERAQGVCQHGTGADGFLLHGIAGCKKRAAPPNGIVTVICISRHERRRRPTINRRPRGDECPASAAGPLKGAGSVPPRLRPFSWLLFFIVSGASS
jgi:hypothetical protein